MGINIATASASADTSGGTQQITTANLGDTPKAALIFVTLATTNGTAVDGLSESIGFTDGTTDAYITNAAEHGQSTTDATRGQNTGSLIHLLNDGGTSDVAVASFSQWISDGIEITWDTTPSAAYLVHVVFFAGSNIDAVVGSASLGNSGTTTSISTSFAPDLGFFATVGESNGASTIGRLIRSFGFAINKTGNPQRAMIAHAVDGGAEARPSIYLDTDGCAGQALRDDLTWTAQANNWTASGVDLTVADGNAGDDVNYLLLSVDGDGLDVQTVDSPTATGSDSVTGTGFTPGFVMECLSTVDTTGGTYASSIAGVFGQGVSDSSTSLSMALANDGFVSTSNTQSKTNNQYIDFDADNGADEAQATFTSFDSDGWTRNFGTFTGTWTTPYKWFSLAIEATGSGGTGVSVDINAGSLTLSGQSQTATAGMSESIGTGSLSLTGQSQTVSAGASTSISPGTLTLTPQALAVQAGVSAQIGTGSLSLTGQSMSVTTGTSESVSVDIQPGTLSLTGQSLAAQQGHSLDMGVGTLTLTGLAQQIAAGASVDVQAGTLSITGQSLDSASGVSIDIQQGNISLSGRGFTTTRGQALDLGAGTLTLTGQSLSVIVAQIETPDGRTLTIPLDARTLTIQAENRELTIPADRRTLKIH